MCEPNPASSHRSFVTNVSNNTSYDLIYSGQSIDAGVLCNLPQVIPAHSVGSFNGQSVDGHDTRGWVQYTSAGQHGSKIHLSWDNPDKGMNSWNYKVLKGDFLLMETSGGTGDSATMSVSITENPQSVCLKNSLSDTCPSNAGSCIYSEVNNPSYARMFDDTRNGSGVCSLNGNNRLPKMSCNDFFKYFNYEESRDGNETIEAAFGPAPFLNKYDGTVDMYWRGNDCAAFPALKCVQTSFTDYAQKGCCAGTLDSRFCDSSWCPANSLTCSASEMQPDLLFATVSGLKPMGIVDDYGLTDDASAPTCNEIGKNGNNRDPKWLQACPYPSLCEYDGGFTRVAGLHYGSDPNVPIAYDAVKICTVSKVPEALEDFCCNLSINSPVCQGLSPQSPRCADKMRPQSQSGVSNKHDICIGTGHGGMTSFSQNISIPPEHAGTYKGGFWDPPFAPRCSDIAQFTDREAISQMTQLCPSGPDECTYQGHAVVVSQSSDLRSATVAYFCSLDGMDVSKVTDCCSPSINKATPYCAPNVCPGSSVCMSRKSTCLKASQEDVVSVYSSDCNAMARAANPPPSSCPQVQNCTFKGDGYKCMVDTYDPQYRKECCLLSGEGKPIPSYCDPAWCVLDPQGKCGDLFVPLCSSVSDCGKHALLETDISKTNGVPCNKWFTSLQNQAQILGQNTRYNPSIGKVAAIIDSYCTDPVNGNPESGECACYNGLSNCKDTINKGGQCMIAVPVDPKNPSRSVYRADAYCKPNPDNQASDPDLCPSGGKGPALNGPAGGGLPLHCWLPECQADSNTQIFRNLVDLSRPCPSMCVQYSGGGQIDINSINAGKNSAVVIGNNNLSCSFPDTPNPVNFAFNAPTTAVNLTSPLNSSFTQTLRMTNPSADFTLGSMQYSVSTNLASELLTIVPSEGSVLPSESVDFQLTLNGNPSYAGSTYEGYVAFHDVSGTTPPAVVMVYAGVGGASRLELNDIHGNGVKKASNSYTQWWFLVSVIALIFILVIFTVQRRRRFSFQNF
jgi:hypothetical protein